MTRIAPCLWFNGQAEEAARFYVSLFPDAAIGAVSRYGPGAPFPTGTALMVEFHLFGQRFQALNGGPDFTFSEAVSLSVACEDATEVDRYWAALTADGGQESQCGWLKDRFGVSWQIVPDGLGALIADPDPARAARALQALMTMKKLDLAAIRAAADRSSFFMAQAPFELSVERYIDAPPETVYMVWTERTEEWFAPKPVITKIIEADLRPGGRSAMIMSGPDGSSELMEGVYLEVIPNRSIVVTDAFTAGWIPQKAFMVGFFSFTPEGKGTRYRAGSRHWDEEAHKQHEAMGFVAGWGAVADQLAELAEAEARKLG